MFHVETFLRTYFNAAIALNTFKTLDAPGSIRFLNLNCSGWASSVTHTTENTILNYNPNASSGTVKVLLWFDWIHCCIRSMK